MTTLAQLETKLIYRRVYIYIIFYVYLYIGVFYKLIYKSHTLNYVKSNHCEMFLLSCSRAAPLLASQQDSSLYETWCVLFFNQLTVSLLEGKRAYCPIQHRRQPDPAASPGASTAVSHLRSADAYGGRLRWCTLGETCLSEQILGEIPCLERSWRPTESLN